MIMAVTSAGSGSAWSPGTGVFAGFCASPYPPPVAHGVFRDRRLGKATRIRRPQGWRQLERPLSAAEPPRAAAAATLSSPTASATDYSSRLSNNNHQRRRRRQHPRLHGVATERSASSTSSPHPPQPSEAFSGRGGAEWAGWECRFSGADGRPVAVPEDYVPESLREWDVEVWGFETLTSEQLRKGEEQGDKNSGGSGTDLLYRKRGRVFPETGCALDNLSLEVNALTSPLEGDDVFVASFPIEGSPSSSAGGHVVAKQPAAGPPSLQLEVGLLVPGVQFTDPSMSASTPAVQDGETKSAAAAAASDGGQEWSRARVEVRVDGIGGGDHGGQGTGVAAAATLGPIVTVTRERKYRDDFDDGLLYKGGGLDSQKLRGLLRSKCFAESEESPTADDLAGNWVSGSGHWQLFRTHAAGGSPPPACAPTDGGATFDRETDGIKTLLLPGGITVRSGPWLAAAAADGSSSAPAKGWGAAGAAALAGETAGFPTEEAEPWAVEVGWFVVEGGEGKGESAAVSREKREVLTTVVDARTMTPLGAWRGAERRG